ncbi:regulating synaptic membrane exocytosis protein 1-like [Cherax quadricarinatus]|uniref:regulating synaptic membrane exocytosis protein 1-like n=1 Tax=Cherax quadricarinatus TaxID=27406 RepID=UPI00387E5077
MWLVLHEKLPLANTGKDHFSEGFASPLEPEMSTYHSAYMNDYTSQQPALGRSPRSSVSPPRLQYNTSSNQLPDAGRISKSVSPPRHQYNNSPPVHQSDSRTPREYTSSSRHPYSSADDSHDGRKRRNSTSPPRYHYNTYHPAGRLSKGGSCSPNNQEANSPEYNNGGKIPRTPRVGGTRPSKVKRYLLTRDPKDRRISGNGLGMKVVGGKEIPGTRGRLGAYIARIHPGGVADALGQLKEGDLVLEWNGITLIDRTYEEVQAIVAQSVDDVEVEIVVRSDINMITGERMTGVSSRSGGYSHPSMTYPSPCYQSPRRRTDYPADDPLDINGNRSTFDGLVVNTTRNNSHENLYINENRFSERENDVALQGKSGDSSSTESPRARSTSRSRHQGNSPDMRGKRQTSPGVERPTNCELRHASEEGLQGVGSISHGGSPLQSQSSPERRSSSVGVGVSGGGGSHDQAENQGGRVVVPSPPRHRTSHSNRRRSSSRNKDSGAATSRGNSDVKMGEVQLQVCYDCRAGILYVTVLRACSLFTLRDDDDTRPDPFIKVYLLPGRSVENQRRTRYLSRTSNPEWNQTMVYPNLQPSELSKRYLEITAWNYQPNKPNEFLGEVVLTLSEATLMDEQSRWYQLQEPDREDLVEQLAVSIKKVTAATFIVTITAVTFITIIAATFITITAATFITIIAATFITITATSFITTFIITIITITAAPFIITIITITVATEQS